VLFLIEVVEQFGVDLRHALGIFLEVERLGFLEQPLVGSVLHEAAERVVLGESARGAQQRQPCFVGQAARFLFVAVRLRFVALFEQLLGFLGEVLDEALLLAHDLLDGGLKLGVLVVGLLLGHRPADDEWRARLVDQDRVDLVDDGEGVLALHELIRLDDE